MRNMLLALLLMSCGEKKRCDADYIMNSMEYTRRQCIIAKSNIEDCDKILDQKFKDLIDQNCK